MIGYFYFYMPLTHVQTTTCCTSVWRHILYIQMYVYTSTYWHKAISQYMYIYSMYILHIFWFFALLFRGIVRTLPRESAVLPGPGGAVSVMECIHGILLCVQCWFSTGYTGFPTTYEHSEESIFKFLVHPEIDDGIAAGVGQSEPGDEVPEQVRVLAVVDGWVQVAVHL